MAQTNQVMANVSEVTERYKLASARKIKGLGKKKPTPGPKA